VKKTTIEKNTTPSNLQKCQNSANLEAFNLYQDLPVAPEQQGMCHHTSSRTLAGPVVFGQKSRWQIQ